MEGSGEGHLSWLILFFLLHCGLFSLGSVLAFEKNGMRSSLMPINLLLFSSLPDMKADNGY